MAEEKDNQLRKERHQFEDVAKMYDVIKAKAIKEFAESLKEKKHIIQPLDGYPIDENDWVIYEEDIDETYKEMVGDTEC